MNNLKKAAALLLALCMIIAMAACGQKEEAAKPAAQPAETKPAETKTEEPKPAEAPAESEEDAWKKEPAYGQVIKYQVGSGCTSGTRVADIKGFFEAEGLQVEGYKADSLVEGLGTNLVQIGVGHIATTLVPTTNGVDIVFTGGAHWGCKSLYVWGASEYKTLEDLKGLKIAVPNGIGNSDYNITARLLDHDGINPLTDVSLVQVENGACVAAMEKGDIAAALFTDVFAYDMVKDGTLRCVRSMLDEDVNHLCCIIAMNGTFAKENPITAAKLTSAIKKAHEWMRENPDECCDLLLAEGLASGDRQKNYDYYTSLKFGPSDEATEEQLDALVKDYKRLGLCTTSDDEATIMKKVWHPLGSID